MNAVFTARGHTDAALRTVMIVAIGAAATYFAPLLPTLESVAVMWFISLVFQSSYYGNVMTALQILTPNRLRATNVAILTIVINMAGAGLGTAIIAALADRVFPGDPRGIGQALTIVGILSGLAAALVAAGGLKRLREAMAQHAQA
jgi:MFS family permease